MDTGQFISRTYHIKDNSYQGQFISWTLDSLQYIKDKSYQEHLEQFILRTNHIENSSYPGQIISRTGNIKDKSFTDTSCQGQSMSRTILN